MPASDRDRAFEAFVAARAPALLRTAYLVSGDGQAAERLVRDALATTYLDWRRIDEREGTEEHARRVMLTAHVKQTAVPDRPPAPPGAAPTAVHDRVWAALRELTPRQRAVLVLGLRDRLDDDEIARVLTCGRKSVRLDAASSLNVVEVALSAPLPESESDSGAAPEEDRRSPLSAASLSSAIRETLAARAEDVRPSLTLTDDALGRADVLAARTRGRRLRGAAIAAGLVVVVAIAAVVLHDGNSDVSGEPAPPSPSSPSPSSGGGLAPSGSVVAVPDTVLTLARENKALVAYGPVIVDGGTGTALVTVDADPANGAARGGPILALARAAFGYVVLTDTEGLGPVGTPRMLSSVRSDGTRVELGRTTVDESGFAVTPDGLQVVHVIQGPVSGENAVAAGDSELVVQDLAADVVNRITVNGLVTPISVTADEVVFRRIDVSAGPAFVWTRGTGDIRPLDLGEGTIAVQQHDALMLARGGAGRQCVSVLSTVDPRESQELWHHCGVFAATRFDPTAARVAVVTSPESDSHLLVLDAQTGLRRFGTALLPGFPFQLEWTATGENLLIASVGADGLVTYASIQEAPGGGGVVTSTRYDVPDGPVVLGQELPLPATGSGSDPPGSIVTP